MVPGTVHTSTTQLQYCASTTSRSSRLRLQDKIEEKEGIPGSTRYQRKKEAQLNKYLFFINKHKHKGFCFQLYFTDVYVPRTPGTNANPDHNYYR